MAKPKLNEDGTFDIKILQAKKTQKNIIVKTETPFGEDTITVGVDKDYLHPTGIPKWKLEVIDLLNRKYEKNYKNTEVLEQDLISEEETLNSKTF